MNVSKNIREGVRVCQNEDDWTAAPSDLRGIAIEYACYFSKKIQEVGRKRAICISPENVVSLLSTVRRAPDGALFSSPKGRFIVRAREKTVAQVVFSVAQIVFRVAHVVFRVARPPSSTVKYP